MTPLQSKIIATWESLHPNFRIILDPNHPKTRFAPWRCLIIRRESQETIGSVTRYTQEMSDPGYEPIVSRLRNSLKHGHLPKMPAPQPSHPQDPLSGQFLPKPKPPKRSCPPSIAVSLGMGYPPPLPMDNPIELTGNAALLWKYGPHYPSPTTSSPTPTPNTPHRTLKMRCCRKPVTYRGGSA